MVMMSCMSRSTAHGLANIASEKRLSGKIMWLLLTVAVLSGFCFHTSLLYIQLQEDQVSTSVQPNSIPFMQPDIVFCSERILSKDIINNPPEEEYEFLKNVSKEIQDVNDWFQSLPLKSSVFMWDALNLHRIFKAFFHRRDEFFLKITCNFREVNVDDLIVEMNILHLACYRLTPRMCNLSTPMSTLIVKLYNHINGLNVNYSRLNVSVDGRPIYSYLFSKKELVDEMEDGIHVYLVQPNELIQKNSKRINASPNTHTEVRITSTRYERVPRSQFKCLKHDPHELVYDMLRENVRDNPLNFTQSSLCFYNIYQRIIKRLFRCVSKQFPIPVNTPPDIPFCGKVIKGDDLFKYLNIVMGKSIGGKKILSYCMTLMPCSSIKYSTYISYSNWPRRSSLRNIIEYELPSKIEIMKRKNVSAPGLYEMMDDFRLNPDNIGFWTNNVMKVTITPDEFMSTVVVESRSYSFKNFFCDTGGILGFYMGASLLTLCELFRVVEYLVHRGIYKRQEDGGREAHPLSHNNEDLA